MSEALPAPQSPPAAAAPARWLSLEAAARLCGDSVGHLRRKCGETLLGQGLARLNTWTEGRKPSWEISTESDPRFNISAVAPSARIDDDFRKVPMTARRKAQERARVLVEWDRSIAAGIALGMDRDKATAMFLENLPADQKITRSTLYKWRDAHRTLGLLGLVDGRVRLPGEEPIEEKDPFLAEVLRVWKTQTRRKIKLCYDIAEDKAMMLGWKICSYRTAHRFITQWQQDHPGAATLAREGPSAFVDKIEPFISRDYSTLATNELWNADHHLFDVLVKVAERIDKSSGEVLPIHARPWLTALQDARSRKIVSYAIRASDPNTDIIIEVLGQGIDSHYAPEGMYTDNGKDFDCQYLTGQTKAMRWKNRTAKIRHDQQVLGGIYAGLQIKHIHAWPFHGQSKPIERFFGTVCSRFSVLLDTFCGRNPQEKPEQLPDMLARGRAPTLEEFSAKFAAWLESDYHGQIHSGNAMGVTPNHAFEANLVTKRTIPTEVLKVITQPRIGPLKVTQQGVRHKGIGYGDREILHLLGREVWIRVDFSNVGAVTVFDSQDTPLAVAHANKLLPFNATAEELRAAISEKKRYSKVLKESGEARLRIHEDVADRMIAARANKVRQVAATMPPQDPTPISVKPVRSDMEGHLPAIQRMTNPPLKKAVGFDLADTYSDGVPPPSSLRLTLTDILGED